jgi:branched-chain amino acid transport system permease protein
VAQGRAEAGRVIQLRQLWDHPVAGAILKVALVVILLPVAIRAFPGDDPPIGVYLRGAIIGSLYGLTAVGLILIYRANRVINFAQAGMGASPAVLAILLVVQRDMNYWWSLPIVLFGSLLIGALIEIIVVRRFANAPRLILTLATIGVAQTFSYFEFNLPTWIGGHRSPTVRFETPFASHARTIGGVRFTLDALITVVLVVVIKIALAIFFRFTRVGMAVRASAENAERAALLGVPVRRIGTIVWMMAALLSAIGVFQRTSVAGTLPVGLVGTSTLLFALEPAVVARMENIPVALGAGMAMGIIDQCVFYTTRNATIAGALILPLLLLALLFQRAKLSRAEDSGVATWRQVKEFRPVPTELRRVREVIIGRWILAAVVVGLVVAFPYLAGPGRQDVASLLIIYAIVGVSLVILTGWGGQISLGHFAFAAVGAAVAGGLVANHRVDFFLAVVLAGFVGAAVAIVIGIPSLRLPGLFLAATTLAFSANMQYFFLQRQYFAWLLPDPDKYVERPVLFDRVDLRSDHAFYFACVAVLLVAVLVARSIRSQRSGRVMIAVRDNTRAAQSYGINPTRTRLAAFAFSGFFAAMAGAMFAHVQGVVEASVFTPDRSLQIFAMTVIGGLTSVGGAFAGAMYVVGFQYFLPKYQYLASGLGMLILLMFFPGGFSEVGFTLRDAFLRRLAITKGIHVPSLLADSRQAEETRADEPDLVIAATESVEAAAEEADEAVPV